MQPQKIRRSLTLVSQQQVDQRQMFAAAAFSLIAVHSMRSQQSLAEHPKKGTTENI